MNAMSSNEKKEYVEPTVVVFTAQELDHLVPLMMSGGIGACSGGDDGGSGSGSSTTNNVEAVYVVNSPDFGTAGLPLGHSAILFESTNGYCELFSFHPRDNASPDAVGSIASIVNWKDSYSFDAFKKACFTVDPKDNSRKGVLIYNHSVVPPWYEPFRRAIKLVTSTSKMNAMRALAQKHWFSPRHYNAISYNCQSFVNEILAEGLIELCYYSEIKGAILSLKDEIVPNAFYDKADNWASKGVSSFSKIKF